MFRGKQPMMRDSKLTNTDCFVPHHTPNHSLQLNDTQHMVFTENDIGPFYLNPREREKSKYDVRTGNKVKKYRIKDDLKQNKSFWITEGYTCTMRGIKLTN